MISVHHTIRPSLQRSYVSRNGGSGKFHDFISAQGATGKKPKELEASWLVVKGGTGKTLSELWGTYLTSKGFTTGSLEERMRAFFTTGVQA